MQEGKFSGNAACESLDLSKQICLQLTGKSGEGRGRHGKAEEGNSA